MNKSAIEKPEKKIDKIIGNQNAQGLNVLTQLLFVSLIIVSYQCLRHLNKWK